ncbi:hypothetical protein AG1IA_00466 [Rhizoctonia solani AG-1 IA]|uniref:Uncharacterized protein n=1 Tax=Thanatephorus cucumeris (strain AG1-IA) TaxID=983506 RepID=L8X5K4_THACA|nr:hypothetical protein AG1IA_00466 [Rhizoctonia solani AG-1 IA]
MRERCNLLTILSLSDADSSSRSNWSLSELRKLLFQNTTFGSWSLIILTMEEHYQASGHLIGLVLHTIVTERRCEDHQTNQLHGTLGHQNVCVFFRFPWLEHDVRYFRHPAPRSVINGPILSLEMRNDIPSVVKCRVALAIRVYAVNDNKRAGMCNDPAPSACGRWNSVQTQLVIVSASPT